MLAVLKMLDLIEEGLAKAHVTVMDAEVYPPTPGSRLPPASPNVEGLLYRHASVWHGSKLTRFSEFINGVPVEKRSNVQSRLLVAAYMEMSSSGFGYMPADSHPWMAYLVFPSEHDPTTIDKSMHSHVVWAYGRESGQSLAELVKML